MLIVCFGLIGTGDSSINEQDKAQSPLEEDGSLERLARAYRELIFSAL